MPMTVVLCRSGSEQPLAVLRQILERMGLSLNEDKSQVVNAEQGKFDFLGFELLRVKCFGSGRHFAFVRPSKRSLREIKGRITELTARTGAAVPRQPLVNELNAAVRGWAGYFHDRNCSRSLSKVRWHLEERMRTHLRRRHKIRDRKRGNARFTERSLYACYGLYRMPTSAGWTKAHAGR